MAQIRRPLLIAIAALVLGVGAVALVSSGFLHRPRDTELALLGNIDLRQIDLAFNNSERIASVLVQEGDRVHAGQVLARLDSDRLRPKLDEAAAEVEAQALALQRLKNGTRPEKIAQARADVAAAAADASNARREYEREQNLFAGSSGRAVSEQDLDGAKVALEVAEAKLIVSEKTLTLAVAGPRKEDIAQARAQLQGDEARLQLLRKQLADCNLLAPADGVVRSRLMEPGEIATPQRPVLSLAVTDPKWVRAYVSEADLGKVAPGMSAKISVDSFPGRQFDGWVGFISPVAEFTPRAVQTSELRTSLVYEVRVFVNDPQDSLRLGMPASVSLALTSAARLARIDPPRQAKSP